MRPTSLAILMIAGALACGVSDNRPVLDPPAAAPPVQIIPLPGDRVPRQLTAGEEAKLKLLEAELPDRSKEFRDMLTDARVRGYQINGSPHAQQILNEIFAARAARAESAWRAERATAPIVVTTTVAMVDVWPDSLATAIAVRRPGATPSDIILVPQNATAANLAAGIQALTRIRQQELRDGPRSVRVVARGKTLPPSWRRSVPIPGNARRSWTREAMTTGLLMSLGQKPRKEISGVGPARSIEISVSVTRPSR